ncbi:MAG: hypothetical protein AWU57_174 [Marinobacter sp. T13-3]|nr:MAG: hypothetical protein AWU57_174 [Marinobacter sp. T13-3]
MQAPQNPEQWLIKQHKKAEKAEVHPYREWTFTVPEGQADTYQVAIIRDDLSTTVICPELKLAVEDQDHLEAQLKLTQKIKDDRGYPANVTVSGTSVPPFVMTWGQKATRMSNPAKQKPAQPTPTEPEPEPAPPVSTAPPAPETADYAAQPDMAAAMNEGEQGDLLDLFTQEPGQ